MLYIIFGALGILAALVVGVFGLGALGLAVGTAASEDPDAAVAIPFIGAIGSFLVVLIVVSEWLGG